MNLLTALKKERKANSKQIREDLYQLNQRKENLETEEHRLKKKILTLQQNALVSPEKAPSGIKKLREQLQDTSEKRQAVEASIQELERLLPEVEDQERLDRIAEIEKEILQINKRKDELWGEFVETYAKASVLLWSLTGHNPKTDIFRPFAARYERRRDFLNKVEQLQKGQQSLISQRMRLDEERARLKREVKK